LRTGSSFYGSPCLARLYQQFHIAERSQLLTLKHVTINNSFLSRVSILTRDIDIEILSVCLSVSLSVRDVPVSDEKGLTYRHRFFHHTVA